MTASIIELRSMHSSGQPASSFAFVLPAGSASGFYELLNAHRACIVWLKRGSSLGTQVREDKYKR